MKFPRLLIMIVLAAGLILLVSPLTAQSVNTPTVIYQTAFSTDPQWTTNNPNLDYWDAVNGTYHFSIEPSNGGYTYVPVPYNSGSFTLEYDLLLQQVDPLASFRLGFSGTSMDRTNGPNVITEFTSTPKGNLFWLRVVTPNQKLVQVSSQAGSYGGPTVTYELNRMYHVQVIYDNDTQIVTERVTDKVSGQLVWSYFVNTYESLYGMNRLYLGSVGDYNPLNLYATGYIDNVRLSGPPALSTPTPSASPTLSLPPTYTPRPATTATTAPPAPTPTQTSPSSLLLAAAALVVSGVWVVVQCHKKN